jgi:hypothetical protein
MKRTLVLCGVSALVAGAIACSSPNPTAPATPAAAVPTVLAELPADGSTLKAEPAVPLSPLNDLKMNSPVVVLTARASTLQFPTTSPPAIQYRFQVLNPAGVVVDNSLVGGTTYQIAATLLPNTRHTWRVRPEVAGEVGPWSTTVASFVTEDPLLINDPLTNGTTTGGRIGGQFVPGAGWQSLSHTDGINYDVPGGCISCTLSFDATNFGAMEGFSIQRDLKWVSMGDWNAFAGFGPFRDHPWKMHFIQRADFPTGMEIIWRNGGTDVEGDPGDHRIKLNHTGVTFSSSQNYHFEFNWTIYGFTIWVNGVEVMEEGWDHWYETPNLRVQLGCVPRGESMVGIIYRNVKLKKH